MADDRHEAARTCISLGWRLFVMSPEKRPLTERGLLDATGDTAIIAGWLQRWPRALLAVATGADSGIVVLDVDVGHGNANGFDTLEMIGISTHPTAPTSHSPAGGCHVFFRHPGGYVKSRGGKHGLGPGLDIRGDGGSAILPPGPRRRWDPVLTLDVPLPDMPAWMAVPEPEEPRVPAQRPRAEAKLSAYAAAALENAVRRIAEAPAGAQETTLNAEAFSIGRLAGGGAMPPGIALDSLLWAARRMPSLDARRPWRPIELERKIKAAFTDGLREPRAVPDGR